MLFERRNPEEDAYPLKRPVRREAALRFAWAALLAVAVTAGYAAARFRGLREPVAMETAQIARHLAEGRGFATHCARPFDWWYLRTRGAAPAAADAPLPAIWTAPALPALQAALFRLARPRYRSRRDGGYVSDAEARVIVPLGIALTLLTTLALWMLGRTLFDGRVASLAAGAYALADLTLATSISGLPAPAASLAAVLALLLAVLAARRSAEEEGGWGVAGLTALCALCAAAAVLADYAMLVVAAAAAALLAMEVQRRRWLMTPLYLLVLALALLPWIMRNTGAGTGILGALPYAALRDTPLFPGDALERSVAPVLNAYRAAAAVRHGFAARLTALASGGGFARGGVMICFFALAVFHRYERSVCRSLKIVALAALAALALMPVPPGMAAGGGWIALYPLTVLFGMSAFTDFLDGEEHFDAGVKPLLTVLLLALCALPAGLNVLRGPAGAYPPYHAPVQQFVAGVPAEGKVLLTDIPWATAWYGGVMSVLLPTHPDDVASLPGGWESIGGVYLTSRTADAAAGGSPWPLILLGRQTPESVPFTHGVSLPAGRHDQLLLSGGEQGEP